MKNNRTIRFSQAVIIMLVCSWSAAHASMIQIPEGDVTVTDVVIPMGAEYLYDYTVTDQTGLLGVLDIAVSVGVPITDLTAPGGSDAFTSTITTVGSGSSELEYVSFIENNGTFTSTPESGFMFESTVAPNGTTFGVTLFDGTTATGYGISGPVSTPEPSTLALFALGGAVLLFWRKRATAFRFR